MLNIEIFNLIIKTSFLINNSIQNYSIKQKNYKIHHLKKNYHLNLTMDQDKNSNLQNEGIDVDAMQKFPQNNLQIIKHNQQNVDPKTILDKFTHYQKLQTQERHNLVKNLVIMLQQLGNQGLPILKTLISLIIKDRQDLSRSLLHKIPQLTNYIKKHTNPQDSIKSILIPSLIEYLNFSSLDIKQQAGKYLGQLAHEIDDHQRGDFILRHVIQMAHDDSNQQNRIVAVQLFSNMSEVFGKSLCEQFIGLELLSLGEDTSFKVRKQAIIHLPIISKLVSKPFFSRLFAFYSNKSKDQSNWAIRKACVQIIINMAELCTKQQKQGLLTQIMVTLLRDVNKWVRGSAYKNLGKFIHLLKGSKINQKLIIQFCRMVDADVISLGKDKQIVQSCAYNFPAVLDALGQNKWQTDLFKVYEKLLKQTDKKIKITLSQSLHQIAKIIGQQKTQKYLFKVVDTFFKDKSDEIKLGVIKHMSEIMHVLSQQKRESLIGVFEEFQKDQRKWRIRECIGQQLDSILQIYKAQTIFYYVLPILFKFCNDNVSIVREEAAKKVGAFYQKLRAEQGLVIGLLQSVKAFGSSVKYTQRQTFLIMCQGLMNDPKNKDVFKQNFMEILTSLADDKVINVRLVLAEIVQKHFREHGSLSEEEEFINLKNKLASDQNDQVKIVFQNQ